jgi:hypothetical protein
MSLTNYENGVAMVKRLRTTDLEEHRHHNSFLELIVMKHGTSNMYKNELKFYITRQIFKGHRNIFTFFKILTPQEKFDHEVTKIYIIKAVEV